MAGSAINSTKPGQIQVRFYTKQSKYALPDTPFSIPSNLNTDALSTLLNGLFKETQGVGWEEVGFDFLIEGEYIRLAIDEHLKLKDIGTEGTIDVEYIEQFPAPEPEDSLNHDDWVSSVHCHKDWILTGCYDNTIHLWNVNGTHQSAITGHCGPVKGVHWIEIVEPYATFVSVSHDQTLMLWKLDLTSSKIECIQVGRGHERSIECVDVDGNASFIATGGWDNMLKIWAATAENEEIVSEKTEGANKDTTEGVGKLPTRTPLMTLPGHKEGISSIVWTENNEIYTASWDHTIKLWDAELGGLKSEIVGNKSFFSMSRSVLNHALITASADRHIRLYDNRSREGSLVKATFTSHEGWVSTVQWSTTNEFLFTSGGHDSILKMWDCRSPKAPLYDMTGHEDKILCADWTNPKVLVSGSADNTLKIFKFNE